MRSYYSQVYAQRRRAQAGGSRWNVIIRTFAFLVLAVSLALFYVWQNVQLVRVGYRVKEKEKVVLELSKRAKALEMDLSMLKMPSRVIHRIQEEGLALSIPEIWQIVKVQEEPVLYEEDLVSLDWGHENIGSGSLIDVSRKPE